MTPILDPAIAQPTAQQIFDAVVRYAARQPERCVRIPGENHCCAYRSLNGTNACHIGALLTDEEAEDLRAKDLITRGVAQLLSNPNSPFPERLRQWELRHFLPRLQGVHDQDAQETWSFEFERIAVEYDLDTTALREAFPT